MIKPNDYKIKIPHDGYLKVFQLENPNLHSIHPHDVLMIDEGQDMNPPVLDIFNKQKYNKIIVGDPNQQIYMFRGAVNALESINATHTYHLTQRFVEFHANNPVDNVCHLTNFKKILFEEWQI